MNEPRAAHRISRENLLRTLPAALQRDPAVIALAEGTARLLVQRLEEIERLRIYPAIDTLEEPLLDILAYDFKVDWWDPDYSLEEKRRTLADSWRVHKMLGTRAAVETAIRAIYPKTDVREWFEYEGGKPYHFKLYIDLSGEKWSESRPKRVLERVDFYKSLRSHMDEFQFTVRPREPTVLRLGGTLSAVASLPAREQEDRFDFRSRLGFGGIFSAVTSIPIPEQRDRFGFQGLVRTGGQPSVRTRIPVPQAGTQ